MKRREFRRGFTLMEVLLVLAILVILGSLVGVGIMRMQKNANISATRSQISMLEDVVNAYAIDVGTCPTTQQGLQALVAPPSDLKNPAKWQGPYLEKQLGQDPWGNDYQYEQTGPDQFRIWSIGPDLASGSEDDIANVQ
ncbi:MAG TPA: type II secretion system major pseudopilin GspG [Pirellulaceae bacterium]|nr:type II secretion system major pseudopilin GspG [Pirellulaceae bacterium]